MLLLWLLYALRFCASRVSFPGALVRQRDGTMVLFDARARADFSRTERQPLSAR